MQDELPGAGERREERGEVLEGVGTAGLAQAGQCTVCAHGVETPCTSEQPDRAQDAREVSECLAPPAATMTENSDKVPIALVGPDDVEFCSPPAYATVTVKPSSPARLLKVGAVVLISGAVLLLFGAIGAFYFWKGSDSHGPPWGARARAGEGRAAAGGTLMPSKNKPWM
ncbi:hypothetical protein P7K49_000417 [Saguinus oedipus]|uniref:Uncharacterized protein n=1 Tax=Saguinus oedipus TaxID=9490 RepID=A0ABQ9WCG1_SAGOE|nr:hypothetical protein P7K49_000417 [Saguinus oedipus]